MSKHTPGPWDNDWYHIVDRDGNAICVVEPDIFSKKREEANTKLITVAPDMLKEIKRLRGMILDLCTYRVAGSKPDLSQTDAIIAKAEGEPDEDN